MNKKDISVVKRDGTRVPYDVSKIKRQIEFATDGTGVSPLRLEATLDQVLKSGVKTSEIQDNIIQHALQLSSKQEPRWINVAGRALAMQQWGNFKLRDKSFQEIVAYNVKKGEYVKELTSTYSPDDLNELGKSIDMTRDLSHSHASLTQTAKKYLGKFELNQHMHMVSAMRFGQISPPESRMSYVADLYNDLSLRKISLASPFMSNLRKGGNVSSCFTLAIEDDLDSIFDNVKRIAKISKEGGGVGIYLGYIRAMGSAVGGTPGAAGSVLQWIKIINDTLVAVNQSFVGDTLVETELGSIPISDVTTGDHVKTHDGTFRKVTGVRSKVNDTPIYKVETGIGVVRGTGGHPVLVVDNVPDARSKIMSGEIAPYWVDVSELTTSHLVIKSK